jgi:predicted DCC family thiol-disulfide oxidoreductase YuxK
LARWIRRRDRAGRVLVIANQKPGMLARYGVTREEANRASWTIDREGSRFEGAASINRVLIELGDEIGGWRALALPYRLTPVAALEEALYRWFARRRSMFRRLGVKPECDEPGSGCE